ncbi:protein serine/threonine phosphatase 2C [Choiromyces venosus 120613-1]|uniref:Protein phosphatase n=1 Tax=Choiromyces venosus 120613-1 TaxID=1336337 RepID=A0A3N4JVV4_9PEZI|nr:protein serine/threonine phosphatase 2C [Choiromyces venosus 120613-1]
MSPALTSVRSFSTKGVDYNNSSAAGSPVTNTTTVNPVASKKFTYQISAAYSAKQKRFSPTTNVFHFNPYNRVQDTAKRKSRPDAGQDAFFVSRINDTGAVAAGVADGVGGYIAAGIDSADFSHTLCERIATAAHQSPTDNINAKYLMSVGYKKILEEDIIAGGASTACVGVAKSDGQLNVANLGDSGFLIIRQGKVHYISSPQTHDFNTPYQLAMIPRELLVQSRQYGGGPLSDQPSDAHVSSHSLRNGDVVVFATDGVWDNLSSQEILRIVSDEMVSGKGWIVGGEAGTVPSPQLESLTSSTEGLGLQSAVAKAVAARAKSASINTKVDGPFAKEVQKRFPSENFHGGKKDDICVVCMVVVEINRPVENSRNCFYGLI